MISVCLKDDPNNCGDLFSLCFNRPADEKDKGFCDIEIAMRPDEALVVASMLTQAVAMSCSAYDVDIDTDKSQVYGNFTPAQGED